MTGFPDIVAEKIAANNSTGKEQTATAPSTVKEPIPFPPPSTNEPAKSQFTKEAPSPLPPLAPAPEPARASKPAPSIEIELGEKKEEVVEKKTINLADDSFFDKEIDKKTAEGSKKEDKKTQKSAEVRSITEEKISNPKLEPESDDYVFIAGILVEILDLGTSTAFRWWAMDTSDQPYEMTKSKKDKLARIVGEGLRRMNKKFPLVVLGIITLVIALYTPARKSNEMRNAKKTEKATKPKTESSATSSKKTPPKETPPKKTGGGGVKRPPGGVSK